MMSGPLVLVLQGPYQRVDDPKTKESDLLKKPPPVEAVKTSKKDDSMFKCPLCSKTFYYRSYLTAHEVRMHGKKRKIKDCANYFSCPYCQKKYTNQDALLRHRRLTHGERKRKRRIKCQEDNCEATFPYLAHLRNHLEAVHGFTNITNSQELRFSNREEFQQWLSGEETRTKAHFTVNKSDQKDKKCNLSVFCCNRSGIFKSNSKGKRQLKSQGTMKIGFFCTAQIRVKTFDSHLEVIYFTEHYKHEKSLCHLPVSKEEKQSIAEKLLQGIDKRKILQDLRISMNTDVEKKHLLTRQDLNNIKRDFSLKCLRQSKMFHSNPNYITHMHIRQMEPTVENDEQSVYTWVEEMRQTSYNPVLFYKRQNEEFAGLHPKDFVLVIMTTFQKIMVDEFNYDRICIDSIDRICDYGFELVTLFAADKYEEGVPIAFCITSTVCREILSIFFNSVKNAVPSLRTKIVMSDDSPLFYDVWQEIFGPCDECFLCIWQVDKSWRKQLNTLKKKGKKDDLYKTMKVLLHERDLLLFNEVLETFVHQLNQDEDIKDFGEYFIMQYSQRSKMWAYCFRPEAKLNSKMHIETYHKNLKRFFLVAKRPKRIDNCIVKLINMANDKKFDDFVKARNKKDSDGYYDDAVSDYDLGNNIEWEIVSESGDSYRVTKNAQLDSVDKFKCTCREHVTLNTACKHINFMLQFTGSIDSTDILIDNNNETIYYYDPSNLEEVINPASINLKQIKSQISHLCDKLNSVQINENSNQPVLSSIEHLNAIDYLMQPFLQDETPLLKPITQKNEEDRTFFSVKEPSSTKSKRPRLNKPSSSDVTDDFSTAESILQKIVCADNGSDHIYCTEE